jgi:hypothetical protein
VRVHVDIAWSDDPSFGGNRSLPGVRINFANADNLAALYCHVTVEPRIACAIDQPATVNHDIELTHYASRRLVLLKPVYHWR